MARLTAPNGSVVNVDDDYAERLVAEQGFTANEKKSSKSASTKSEK